MNWTSKIIIALIAQLFLTINLWAQQPPAGGSVQKIRATDTARQQSKTAFIEILSSDYTDIIKSGAENITKIVGNVKLRSGSDILYCDSAILYQEKKIAEAFGEVYIEQADGTTAFADYLKYSGANKTVYMLGNVVLSNADGNTLWSEEVEYNLNTKVGKYFKQGTLQNETTVLSSKRGEYNLKSNDARFVGDVVVNDPEYKATSEEITYNTKTRLVRFIKEGIVQNESTTLFAKGGSYYNAEKKFAELKGRSNIIHGSQFIEADEMKYNQLSGWAMCKGKVIAVDTAERSTIWCGQILYNDQNGKMQATIKPIIRRAGEEDTLYQRSDTVFSEPIVNLSAPNAGAVDTAELEMEELILKLTTGVPIDSLQMPELTENLDEAGTDSLNYTDAISEAQSSDTSIAEPESPAEATHEDLSPMGPYWVEIGAPDTKDSIPAAIDSLTADTIETKQVRERPAKPEQQLEENAANRLFEKSESLKEEGSENSPRYFLLYHNVIIYSDSAQAKGDSLRYSQADSMMILYHNPVVWGKGAQISGDTIIALIDSNKVHEVFVPRNAILIQQNGPEQAGMFDQIQGVKIHAFFKDNELEKAIAYPNAETIYFAVDEDSAYIGASKASSERLFMYFKNRKIERIHYLKDFNQKMTPMSQVEPATFRLDRFHWREAERPKSLYDFLADAEEWQLKAILGNRYASMLQERAEKSSEAKP